MTHVTSLSEFWKSLSPVSHSIWVAVIDVCTVLLFIPRTANAASYCYFVPFVILYQIIMSLPLHKITPL